MAKVSLNHTLAMMLTVVCMGMLQIPTGLAYPNQPVPDVQKCWSSLTNIPSCLTEIYGSLLVGQIGKIGPACCTAINQISDSCWTKMFPFNPFFSPLLKNFCASPPPQTAGSGINAAATKVVSLPRLLPPVLNETEIIECWSSLTNTEGCALEIYKSLTTGQIVGIGPACCKAVTEINDKCWPKMFPFNPFFPPLLKNTCAKVPGLHQHQHLQQFEQAITPRPN